MWWEGRTPEPPADVAGWRDWTGKLISERTPEEAGAPWAHPNSRFTTTLANVPNIAKDYDNPAGVPIDGIIFGGRTSDREPLIRAITDVAEGVYDGLTLGAEATFAADGLDDDHLHPGARRLGVQGPERRAQHRPAVHRRHHDRELGDGGRRSAGEARHRGILSLGEDVPVRRHLARPRISWEGYLAGSKGNPPV